MRLQFKAGNLEASPSGAVFLFEDDKADLRLRSDLAALKKTIQPLLKAGQFKASYLAQLPLRQGEGWLFLVGLGLRAKVDAAKVLEAGAAAAKMAQARNLKSLDLALPSFEASDLAPEEALEQAACGSLLALYQQREFKSQPGPEPALQNISFLAGDIKNGQKILERARIGAEAVCLVRRLGDRPPNLLYPQTLAEEALSLAKPLKLKVKVLDDKALAKEKMNLILAVGAGSSRPPRLVKIDYQGAAAGRKPIVLVGKGITFDSGGMSLKPAGSLEGMKTDMAGAATVLAVITAAARMKLPVNLSVIMALAENMPDGGGFRVGDVIAGRSGLTVEITNTDAEGRLVLADALALAGETKAAAIIDVATLTGACAVALGDRCAGLFSTERTLRRGLMDASAAVGENFWPLPLLEDYESNLKSESADMVNAPLVPRGGAINAALFLKRFVPPQIPWAHLDIAGPGRTGKARPSAPAGASGFAVRALLRYLRQEAGRK